MVEMKSWSANLKGRDQLADRGVEGRIVLILVLKKFDIKMWT
jgi:hypothetical protein